MFLGFSRQRGKGALWRIAADPRGQGLPDSGGWVHCTLVTQDGAMKRFVKKMRSTFAAALLVAFSVAGCANGLTTEVSAKSMSFLPAMRWDHRPEAKQWTTRSLAVVAANDARLAKQVPKDIEKWCPAYPNASMPERRAFWAGLLSATAKHESTWNPRAAGGGGKWIGLMQISPATARQYGCEAKTSKALKDGAANLACAVRIMSAQVNRDGVVAGKGNRGIGRDWAPFRSASKRADIAGWTSKQDYCNG